MPENPVQAKISIMNWMQAADDASKVTPQDGLKGVDKLDSNIRLLFSLAGNYLANQNPDVHQAAKLLEDESKIEFIVLSDLFMTPSAKYADVLLPETSFMERWNIGETWGTASYLILSEKLIEPDFERRTDYDWLRDVAKKLGVEAEFSQGRDEKQWIEHIWEQTRLAMPDENLPDFATLQKHVDIFSKARRTSLSKQIFAIRRIILSRRLPAKLRSSLSVFLICKIQKFPRFRTMSLPLKGQKIN